MCCDFANTMNVIGCEDIKKQRKIFRRFFSQTSIVRRLSWVRGGNATHPPPKKEGPLRVPLVRLVKPSLRLLLFGARFLARNLANRRFLDGAMFAVRCCAFDHGLRRGQSRDRNAVWRA